MQRVRRNPDTKTLVNTVETVQHKTNILLTTPKKEAFGSHRSSDHFVTLKEILTVSGACMILCEAMYTTHIAHLSVVTSFCPFGISLRPSIPQIECHLTLCWNTQVGWVGTSCSVICSPSAFFQHHVWVAVSASKPAASLAFLAAAPVGVPDALV